MITQQQALEALEALTHSEADGWGPVQHFTTLRQYIEQSAQPLSLPLTCSRSRRSDCALFNADENKAFYEKLLSPENLAAEDAAGGVLAAGALSEKSQAQQAEDAPSDAAHTDHPMRHFDRTCPACIAQER